MLLNQSACVFALGYFLNAFEGTFRELSKFVLVGIPEFSSKSGKRPLI